MEFERQETRDRRGDEEASDAGGGDADGDEDENSAVDEEFVAIPVAVPEASASSLLLALTIPMAKENGDGTLVTPLAAASDPPGRTEIPHAC